jgi:hypothetical protein
LARTQAEVERTGPAHEPPIPGPSPRKKGILQFLLGGRAKGKGANP